jgi:HEAT repeat protein
VKRALLCLAVLLGLPCARAGAYVDHMSGFTLGYVIEHSPTVVVLQVEKVSLEKRVIVFRKVADLKGKHPTERVKHQLREGLQPYELKAILDWAEPGRIAVCFHDGKAAQTCIGRYWYQCQATEDAWWVMSHGQGDLCFAYWGPAERLRQQAAAMLAGREVVVTALRRSPDNAHAREAVFQNLPRGTAFPVWRVKASLKMPPFAYRLGKDNVVGMGAGGKEDVPPLVKALREGDRRARAEAAEELGLIGPAAAAALPALRAAGKGADARARVSASLALARIDPKEEGAAVPALAAALKEGAAEVRAAAAAALGKLGPAGGRAVPELTKALEDGDPRVRWAAADALGQIGPAAKAAVPALLDVLKDERASVRALAAQALGEIGREGDAKDAVPALLRGLRDPERQARRQAAWALAKLGAASTPAAKEAVKVLTDGLTGPWEWGATLAVLVRFRADSVPALVDALQRGDAEVRKAAANLFLQLGPDEYRSAVPALTEALKDPDGYVRFRCAVALMHVGPEAQAALPALAAMLKDEWGTNRQWAAVAAGMIGKQKELVPVLLEALKTAQDGSLRRYAAQALGRLGPEAEPAAAALAEALKDGDEGVRAAAAEALKRVRPR